MLVGVSVLYRRDRLIVLLRSSEQRGPARQSSQARLRALTITVGSGFLVLGTTRLLTDLLL